MHHYRFRQISPHPKYELFKGGLQPPSVILLKRTVCSSSGCLDIDIGGEGLDHGEVVLEKDITLFIGGDLFKVSKLVTDIHHAVAVGAAEIRMENLSCFLNPPYEISCSILSEDRRLSSPKISDIFYCGFPLDLAKESSKLEQVPGH